MTSSYSLADVLPKDAAGAKQSANVDLATSQLDYSLIAGIGTKIYQSKNYSATWTAATLAGSKIETPTVGNLAMGALTTNPSAIAFGNAIPIRADDRGQLFVSGLSSVATAYASTSRDTITTASGLIYRIVAAACGGVAGAQVRFLNGATSLTHVVFNQTSDTITVDFGTGACFSSLITEKFGTVAPIYITTITRGYGLG